MSKGNNRIPDPSRLNKLERKIIGGLLVLVILLVILHSIFPGTFF